MRVSSVYNQLKMRRVAQQLVGQGISHPKVALCVRMQKVMMLKALLRPSDSRGGFRGCIFHCHATFTEISGVLRLQREKATNTREINYRNSPNISGFLYDLNIVINIEPERVGVSGSTE